jgi:hypothetical protein
MGQACGSSKRNSNVDGFYEQFCSQISNVETVPRQICDEGAFSTQKNQSEDGQMLSLTLDENPTAVEEFDER